MINRGIFPIIVLICMLLIPNIALSYYLSDLYNSWQISGSNTFKVEYYDIRGKEANSPYKYENTQTFNELNINLFRRPSAFSLWRVQLLGLWNDSSYRNVDKGFILERFNLLHENGDTLVPYRFELGDFYAYFSYRTLQRPLKGFYIELQPQFSSTTRNSIMFISGADQRSWMNFQPSDSYYNGISLLSESDSLGRFSINFINNVKSKDPTTNQPDRVQNVLSFAFEKKYKVFKNYLSFEGEIAYFNGDVDDTNGLTGSGQNKEDTGLYFQLTGQGDMPFNYRVRFERYGEFFNPAGATVNPNRKSWEIYGDWYLNNRVLKARFQNYRDDFQSDNPIDTEIYGLNLSGRILKDITGYIDCSLGKVKDTQGTKDYNTKNINIILYKFLTKGISSRLNLYFQETDDKLNYDSNVFQASASIYKDIDLSGFKGVFSPGITYRRIKTSVLSEQWSPLLLVLLKKGPHSFSYSMALNRQDNEGASTTDITNFTNTFRYNLSMPMDILTFEVSTEERNPEPGENTKTYRVAFMWRHSFFKQKKSTPDKDVQTGQRHISWQRYIDLTELLPGEKIQKVTSKLEEKGLEVMLSLPGLYVYETSVFNEIPERQRLVLVHDGQYLINASVIIDPPANRVLDVFNKLSDILISRYGKPTSFYFEGTPSGDIVTDINNGRLVRVQEWKLRYGILRLGIPRRADGQVRIEVQYAKGFPPYTEKFWSIEQLR